jgi:hypothetical protein
MLFSSPARARNPRSILFASLKYTPIPRPLGLLTTSFYAPLFRIVGFASILPIIYAPSCSYSLRSHLASEVTLFYSASASDNSLRSNI